VPPGGLWSNSLPFAGPALGSDQAAQGFLLASLWTLLSRAAIQPFNPQPVLIEISNPSKV